MRIHGDVCMVCWMESVHVSYQYVRLVTEWLQYVKDGLHFGSPVIFALLVSPCFQVGSEECHGGVFPWYFNF